MYSSKTPTFYQNVLAMRNTEDVTDGKPISSGWYDCRKWKEAISGYPNGTGVMLCRYVCKLLNYVGKEA
jgi:hypothetical protein